jgi:cysteine-rich repeat protein
MRSQFLRFFLAFCLLGCLGASQVYARHSLIGSCCGILADDIDEICPGCAEGICRNCCQLQELNPAEVEQCVGVCGGEPWPDCAGVSCGHAVVDRCGTCDNDPANDCVADCAGVFGGDAVADRCDTCDNDPANDCVFDVEDCVGLPRGACGWCCRQMHGDENLIDIAECVGACNGNAVLDCAGVFGGDAVVDRCGTCDNDPANDCVADCAGVFGGDAVVDQGGCCVAADRDCAGRCNGAATDDAGGCCVAADRDCTGACNGNAVGECDDGNLVDGDGCDSNCTWPRCGNGITALDENGEEEACDDGNDLNTDGCVDCQLAVCGDGHVQAGLEACDDGNAVNVDECTDQCRSPICGNGEEDPGEECDDGNNNNADACRNNCLASCGADECVCSLLTTVTPSFDFSLHVPRSGVPFKKKVTIPGLGKGVGAKFGVGITAKGQLAHCGNDCKGSFKASLRGVWGFELLTEKVEAQIGGSYSVLNKHCELCDPETCQASCGKTSCRSAGGAFDGQLDYTRSFPLFPPKRFSWGPVKGEVGCEASVGLGIALSGSGTKDEPGDAELCENCTECARSKITVGGNINGGLNCGLGIKVGSLSGSGRLAGQVRIGAELTREHKGPECDEPGTCFTAEVSAMATAKGGGCMNVRWFNAIAHCKVSLRGRVSQGCVDDDSDGDPVKYECSAGLTNGGACQSCQVVCTRGKACGNSCIQRSKTCRQPKGAACQGEPPDVVP